MKQKVNRTMARKINDKRTIKIFELLIVRLLQKGYHQEAKEISIMKERFKVNEVKIENGTDQPERTENVPNVQL